MKPKFGIRACLVLLLAAIAFAGVAAAQGINITLRANANPFPAHDRYANVWGDGNFAYVGSYNATGVLIFDITNPDAPVLAANYTYTVDNPICFRKCDDMLEDVEVQNGIGYFASNYKGGIHIVDLSNPYSPKLITRITSAMGGWDSVHTLLVHGNYLYVPHFLVDPYMQVWDISNPASPVLKWTFLTTDTASIRASSIRNNRLYTSGRSGHTDIWDVTNIATQPPVLLGTIVSGTLSHSSSPTPDGNYLVASRELNASGGDVRIYNVANPANPTQASLITMAGYGIESVSPHNPAVMGNLLFHSWYDAGMVVFDITDPTNPIMVGSYDTWPGPITISQYDGDWGVYPYLGQDRVLVSDQDTGLYILDASGVNSNPVLFNYLVNPPAITSSSPITSAATTLTGTAIASGKAFLLGVAPAGGVTVNVSGTGPATPTAIMIPAGQRRNTAPINTSPVASPTSATVTASYNGVNTSAAITVVPPALLSATVSPASVAGGTNANGTVTLNAITAVNTQVTLNVVSGAAAIASMPVSVTVPAGSLSANWTISTKSVSTTTPVTISATLGAVTTTAGFSVGLSGLTSVTFAPNQLVGGANTTGTVTLSGAVSADTTVTLAVASGGSAISSIPGTVTVVAGHSSATFPIVTAPVTATTSVQVSASANGGSVSGTFTALPPVPASIVFLTSPVAGGNATQVRVVMQKAVAANTTVVLAVLSGAGAVKSMPSSAVVSPGHNTVVFSLSTNTVSTQTTVQISATANGGTVTGTETVAVP